MLIRSALLSDLNGCLALDANSQTDHVWQMDARREGGAKVIRFHTVRLPRVMRVVYPRQRDDLLECWQGGATVLVASDRRAPEPPLDAIPPDKPARVFGYCQLDASPWQQTADIVERGEKIGTVKVGYLQAMPESDEGPFLKEERDLLNTIARRMGEISERRRGQRVIPICGFTELEGPRQYGQRSAL